MMVRSSALLAAACAAALSLAAGNAFAQADTAANYPKQPVKLLVGFGAGGGIDLFARVVAQNLSEKLGQPVVVENRPGAGSMIALDAVARAAPDGHTIGVAPFGTLVINPAIYSKMLYDPVTSFQPISIVATYPFVLTIAADNPAKSLAELIAAAKAQPDKANYGSSAPVMQLLSELFKSKTGTTFEHIPVKSTAEGIRGLITREFSMSFIDPGPLMGPLRAGQVRALGISSDKRFPELPDVPTLAEAGVPGVEFDGYMGIVGPRGLPPAIVKRLETELIAMTTQDDFKQRLKIQGLMPVGSTSAEYADRIDKGIPIWKAVAKSANIKLD